jgi:hypothetical protein
MKNLVLTLAVGVLAASLLPAQAGDITGKITLKGTPPAAPQLPFDPMCGKLHTGPKNMPWYVVGKGGELADVFIYLKDGVTGKKYEVPAAPAILDQVGCEYVPYVLGAQTGQTIRALNSDPLLHNVHPTPTVAGNKEMNRAQLPKGPPLDHVFPNQEVFLRFKCDVHPWMFAYVGVVDHPFFAVSGKDGTFTIKNVPPGKYTIEAVHRKTHPTGKGETKEVTVAADGGKVDFVIEVK